MPMPAVEVTPETLDAAGRALAGTGPVHMLNLLRYRAQAEYAQQTDLPPCSGREAYFSRYVPAFARVAEQVAPGERFMPIYLGTVQTPSLRRRARPGTISPSSNIRPSRCCSASSAAANTRPKQIRTAAPHWQTGAFYATTKVDLPG